MLIGVGGGIGMTLARKGRRPPWLGPALNIAIVLGIVATAVGIFTATSAQPFSMWLGTLISGSVVTAFAIAIRRQLHNLTTPNSSRKTGGGGD